jgi:hypothetical protein
MYLQESTQQLQMGHRNVTSSLTSEWEQVTSSYLHLNNAAI